MNEIRRRYTENRDTKHKDTEYEKDGIRQEYAEMQMGQGTEAIPSKTPIPPEPQRTSPQVLWAQ
jgi:hypothetical protein